jgi:hypothetical protein
MSNTQPQPTLPIVSGNWWAQLFAMAGMADLSADHDPRLALPVSYRSRGRSGGAANTPEPGPSGVCR